MNDSDASSSSDEELEGPENDEQKHKALDVQIRKPQASSSTGGTPSYVSKMERYLKNLASDPKTHSCMSERKQEGQTLYKRGTVGRSFSLSLPPTEDIEVDVFKDVRKWVRSEERIQRNLMGDNLGEEDEQVDNALFEKFKNDMSGTARMKFLKRKLADSTVDLEAYAQEIVEETFENAVQEMTSAVWQELQDARKHLHRCAIADEQYRSRTAKLEEHIRFCVQMQTRYLREVSKLRDQLDHGRSEKIGQAGIDVHKWNPLYDLDPDTRALVTACTEEQVKLGFSAWFEDQEALKAQLKVAEEATVLAEKKTSAQSTYIATLREELVLAQNKISKQATDFANLREELDQARSKPPHNDSKADVTSETPVKEVSCAVCGACVAIPADLLANVQETAKLPGANTVIPAESVTAIRNKDCLETAAQLPGANSAIPADDLTKVQKPDCIDTAAKLLGAHEAITADCVTDAQKQNCIDKPAKLPVAPHAGQPRLNTLSKRKQSLTRSFTDASLVEPASEMVSHSSCQSHEQAHEEKVQHVEECADESHKQLGPPANVCAAHHVDDVIEQSANSGQQDHKKEQDGSQTARAPGRTLTLDLDVEKPLATARRKSSVCRAKTLGQSAFNALDLEGSAAKHRGPQDNPTEKTSLLVSGLGTSRKNSLPSVVPSPTHGKMESPRAQAVQDSATDEHNKPGSVSTRKASISVPLGQAAVVSRRNSKSSTELTAKVPSFDNGLQVSGAATAVVPSGLEGASQAMPKYCQEDSEGGFGATSSSGVRGPQKKWRWLRPLEGRRT